MDTVSYLCFSSTGQLVSGHVINWNLQIKLMLFRIPFVTTISTDLISRSVILSRFFRLKFVSNKSIFVICFSKFGCGSRLRTFQAKYHAYHWVQNSELQLFSRDKFLVCKIFFMSVFPLIKKLFSNCFLKLLIPAKPIRVLLLQSFSRSS